MSRMSQLGHEAFWNNSCSCHYCKLKKKKKKGRGEGRGGEGREGEKRKRKKKIKKKGVLASGVFWGGGGLSTKIMPRITILVYHFGILLNKK